MKNFKICHSLSIPWPHWQSFKAQGNSKKEKQIPQLLLLRSGGNNMTHDYITKVWTCNCMLRKQFAHDQCLLEKIKNKNEVKTSLLIHVLIHYSIKPQLDFNPYYQSSERWAAKEWKSKCLPGEEGRAEWKMRNCRDIGGSGQFLITKVLISVAKGFIEIRIACGCVHMCVCVWDRKREAERMNRVLWKRARLFSAPTELKEGKKGGESSRG